MQPDFLSQLNDIQTPEQIGWWPLAWGWYLVALVIILLLTLVVWFAVRHLRVRRAKNQALKRLKQLKPDESPLHTVKQINNILKRVVLSYAKRSDVAELSGTAWADWLNRYSAPNYKINNEFVSLAYATKCQPEQAEAYLQQAKLWVSKNLPLNPKFKKEATAHV